MKILIKVNAPYQLETIIREGPKNYTTDRNTKIDKHTLCCVYPSYIKDQYRFATEEDINFCIKQEKSEFLKRYEVDLRYYINILTEFDKYKYLSEQFFEDLHDLIKYLKEDLQGVEEDLQGVDKNE